ncbi:MAG: substrate-binding domain-containing protein [Victivallales bacterium]
MKKASTVKEQLLKRIKSQRESGRERLAPERELALDFGCSRSTIVKVLDDLEVEGIIYRKGGSGTFIHGLHKRHEISVGLLMRLTYQAADDHFRTIVDALSVHASESGIQLHLFDGLSDIAPDAYRFCAPMTAYEKHKVDGFLLMSRLPLSLAGLLARTAPAISINNIFGDGQEIPAVTCDYFRAGFLAGRHLLAHGHSKIAYLTEDAGHPETFQELSGFRSALETAGIAFLQSDILETKQMPEIFFRRSAHFFSGGNYTACFLRNVNLVRPLLACFNTLQIKVPEDISIITAGDYSHTRERSPEITVIDTRLREISCAALETLSAMIRDKKQKRPAFRLLEPRLIERNSVKRMNAVQKRERQNQQT